VKASVETWREKIDNGRFDRILIDLYGDENLADWQSNYCTAIDAFVEGHGDHGEIIIARCPSQMNLMGMHIDYGGMPSVRLAVRGSETITVAREHFDGRIRISNHLECDGYARDEFKTIEFDLKDIIPNERVHTRQLLMNHAGMICERRLEEKGTSQEDDWSVLVQGQLIYLESYFRSRGSFSGMDASVWSNVSPSGGMSSSSALVISTAIAAMGVNEIDPRGDMDQADLVDGIGTSEWIRGTRGGTADHGGMLLGESGKLVGVGVFPATVTGIASLPKEYVAFVMDTGVPRIYEDTVKEETVIAYPLGTFFAREVFFSQIHLKEMGINLKDGWYDRVNLIRDLNEANLGVDTETIYRLLIDLPAETDLHRLRNWAHETGKELLYDQMYNRDIEGKFGFIDQETPIYLRRRFAFGLAEQDRVRYMLEYMKDGSMDKVFELMRISHVGDFDSEVTIEDLEMRIKLTRDKKETGRLCYLPGGYGRMTADYDKVVRSVNDYLVETGGAFAGAVQRLGAGWGGNLGGLVHRDYVEGQQMDSFAQKLSSIVGKRVSISENVAFPGQGADLFELD
jgi:galactokinase